MKKKPVPTKHGILRKYLSYVSIFVIPHMLLLSCFVHAGIVPLEKLFMSYVVITLAVLYFVAPAVVLSLIYFVQRRNEQLRVMHKVKEAFECIMAEDECEIDE